MSSHLPTLLKFLFYSPHTYTHITHTHLHNKPHTHTYTQHSHTHTSHTHIFILQHSFSFSLSNFLNTYLMFIYFQITHPGPLSRNLPSCLWQNRERRPKKIGPKKWQDKQETMFPAIKPSKLSWQAPCPKIPLMIHLMIRTTMTRTTTQIPTHRLTLIRRTHRMTLRLHSTRKNGLNF